MIEISEAEILRRLKLVRDTRLNYLKKYNIETDDVGISYNLLENLDSAEYLKAGSDRRIEYGKYTNSKTITHFDPIKDAMYNHGEQQCYWGDSTTISGKFEQRLGYIFVREDFLKEDYTDEEILEDEKIEFEDLISYLKHRYFSDIKYKKQDLENLKQKINKIQSKLDVINEIDVNQNAV
jgi:hypothetical protein